MTRFRERKVSMGGNCDRQDEYYFVALLYFVFIGRHSLGVNMQKWKRQAIAILLLIATIGELGTTIPVAFAEATEQYESTLESLSRKMREQLGKVNQIKQEVNTVSGQLDAIETDLERNTNELKSVESRLMATQKRVEENQELLQKTERSIAVRSQVLNKRIRDIYMNGQVSYIDVLFGATNFSDFITRYELLKRVLRADMELIAKAKAERELVTQKKNELERDLAVVQNLRQQAVEKRTMVASRYQAKRDVLDNLETERSSAQLAYDELQQASSRIEAMIRARKGGQAPTGGQVTGRYIWPASGPITSPFGWRTHPIFGNQRLHAGIDIGADYGDTVIAADGGVVITSGWISGYGKTIIIEHNGTYSTLYGHNSELLVSEGEIVRKGQPIARVGETGYTTGPVSHFEVRVNGAPNDPLSYLP